MAVPTLQQIWPAFIAVTTYLTIILIAEISRKIVDLFTKKNTKLYIFLIELIAVAQQCTCVYENGVIIRHYGPTGFFFAVFGILLVTSRFNRGAFVSPFGPIEQWYFGSASIEKLLTVLLAQTIGGYSAFRLANGIWFYSMDFSSDHAHLYRNLPCAIQYKVPFLYVFLFEIISCFVLRLLVARVPEAYKRFIVPVIFASFLSFALSNIGIPGLNPVTAASRLQGCPGLDLQWFIVTYYFTPVIGWLAAASLDRRLTLSKGGKGKKKK
ncbi:Aquaporin [Aphelenchoides bicaudatus]|nr:Aquaporin [Aphelenchoides bicaudatus]